jgi:hypothetical protein
MVQVFDLDQHSKDKEPCRPQVFLILSNIKSSFINHLVPGKSKKGNTTKAPNHQDSPKFHFELFPFPPNGASL